MVSAAAAVALAGVRAQMVQRANFLVWVVMGLVYQGTGFVFIWVLLDRFQAIAGWTLGEIAFLYGLRLLSHAIYALLFNALSGLSRAVRRGDLDRFLVRPMPLLVQLQADKPHVSGFGDLLGGVLLFGVANAQVGVAWTPLALVYLGFAIAGAVLVEAAIALAVGSLAFRFLEISSLHFFFDELISTVGNYPMRIYGAVAQVLLTFVLPVAFVAYLPSAVLLGRTGELHVHPSVAYAAPLVGVVLYVLAYRFWRGEVMHYQSAGH